ncbi:hypothetical protein Y11_41581 [Yersinia enterocolitica subsp. palearctica Y11]|uniref:Uncharacterized protein n=1 Tax=Yersinia enterocolitica subsp. palearctica serotype O:3 (strain DSM 13030 / CIP 106945 / Y11) TaxID=930944 RepID=A0A0H3NTQ3_YERE1|nr:hypothetical protein Y11_41581 [Yersinia enterocolitica subsp. palearctica Y11]CCO66966.1 hypothetical protein D322_70 [Yersinia enterocolitica IP 10393]
MLVSLDDLPLIISHDFILAGDGLNTISSIYLIQPHHM